MCGCLPYELFHSQGMEHYFKHDGEWLRVSSRQAKKTIEYTALGLLELGMSKGCPLAILSRTRREWSYIDYATLHIGAITVGVHDSLPPEELRYILDHSEARIIVVENGELLQKHIEMIRRCPKVGRIIVFDPVKDFGDKEILSYNSLLARGKKAANADPGKFESLLENLDPDDVATYMYTSGTTGPPKAVVLTHNNLYETAIRARRLFEIYESDVALVWLPMSHILQRIAGYSTIGRPGKVYFAEGIHKLMDNISEVRPTTMVCVPRLFEKVHAGVLAKLERANDRKKRIFAWAMETGKQVAAHRKRGLNPPLSLKLKHLLADKLVLSKIRAVFGGRLRLITCGGAPLAKDIAEFFHSCGLTILEGYGLSESTGVSFVNRPNSYKFGTVGPSAPDVEVRIAEDGEILLRSPGIFSHYLKDPNATAETFDNGWFMTGDIGRLDEDGHLMITDRKKDIIVNAGGKNISPQNIEGKLKQNPLISQVLVHGDRRAFLSALITIDEEELANFAAINDIAKPMGKSLVRAVELEEEIERMVSTTNLSLANHEKIRKYAILEREFSVEGGELTPTMKVKRKVVGELYADILEGFYG